MHSTVVGSSVQGEPFVYISAFVVLLLFAFARPWAEGLVRLVQLGGLAVALLLIGSAVSSFELQESNQGPPGALVTHDAPPGLGRAAAWTVAVATPSILGLAGTYLVLEGLAWSLLWVVVVLLFAAYLKAANLLTIVVVLLVGAGIGWVAWYGSPELQAAVAVAVVWFLLIGGAVTLANLNLTRPKPDATTVGTTAYVPVLGVALLWVIALTALWVGTRRLIGI